MVLLRYVGSHLLNRLDAALVRLVIKLTGHEMLSTVWLKQPTIIIKKYVCHNLGTGSHHIPASINCFGVTFDQKQKRILFLD
jgi:hypothetical protein